MTTKKLVSALSVVLLLGAGAPARALAPDQKGAPGQDQKKPETQYNTGSSAQQGRTVVGTVKEYEPGKTLTVATRDNNVETFKLDDMSINVKLSASLAVGQGVKVVESTDSSGKKTLTVEAQKSSD